MHNITNEMMFSGNNSAKYAGTGRQNIPEKVDKKLSFHMELAHRTAGSIPVWDSEVKNEKNVASENYGFQANFESNQKKDEAFGFGDLIDMINPFHHIPIVSTFYRHITGDEIKPVSRIFGGAVFGGVIGAAGGIINAAVQTETGDDITGNIVRGVTSVNSDSSRSYSATNVRYGNLKHDTGFVLNEMMNEETS